MHGYFSYYQYLSYLTVLPKIFPGEKFTEKNAVTPEVV